MEKTKPVYLWAILPIVISVFQTAGLASVLPKIMQDEYIYSTQARNLPFESQPFANYLFSWVMSGTKICGPEFYACTKLTNAILFMVGIVFVTLIALRFVSFGWAIFIASVTALSPIVIQTSYFMPETMYFTIMSISVWVTIVAGQRSKWWLWIFSGSILGLAALVKPHAIFLVPAVAIFAAIVDYKKFGSSLKRALFSLFFVIVGFTITRLFIGYAFAGQSGLELLGGYGSPVDGISGLATVDGESTEESNSDDGVNFLSILVSHLVSHGAVFAILAGLPMVLAVRVTFRIIWSKGVVGEASKFMLLLALMGASLLALVPTFEAYVSVTGDDHTLRLILRYYEFLIPIFLIASFMMEKFVESKTIWRLIQALTLAAAILTFSIIYPQEIATKFADSSTLVGFDYSPALLVVAAICLSGALIFWAYDSEKGGFIYSRVALPGFLILAMFLTKDLLVSTSTTQAYFGYAGQAANRVLSGQDGSEIVVVGTSRTEVFTAKFWIDKARIEDDLVESNQPYNLSQAGDNRFVLVLGGIETIGDATVLESGEGFEILELGN